MLLLAAAYPLLQLTVLLILLLILQIWQPFITLPQGLCLLRSYGRVRILGLPGH